MRRRDFLASSGLVGAFSGCLRLVEDDPDTGAGAGNRSAENNSGLGTTERQSTDSGENSSAVESGDEDDSDNESENEELTAVSGTWTAFGNGPANVGLAESAAGIEEYELTWKQESSGNQVPGPILADGTLYTFGDGLKALNAATGELIWRAAIPGGRPTPTVVGDGIVAGNSSRTAFVDLDGNVEWQISSGGDGHAVADGTIYTAGQGNVWAFDLTGELAWDSRIDERTTAAPAAANGILCVGTRSGHVFAFDADHGDRKWSFDVSANSERNDPAGYDITHGVTIYDETVYFGTWDRAVYAVDIETGELEWRRQTNGGIDVCPAAADGTIYVGNDGGRILALDAATGDLKWESDRLGGSLRRGIALADDIAYTVGNDGLIAAVDRSDGSLHWRHLMSAERIRGSPAVADGRVFVTDGAGTTYAFAEA